MEFSNYAENNTKISTDFVSASDGVCLLTIRFQPKIQSAFPPVIFLPGWGSLIDSWQVVLKKMTENFEVYYVETREKSSSQQPKEKPLTIDSLGDDLPYILKHYNLSEREYLLFGSSLGATVILDSISKNKVNPCAAILVGPNAEFNAPKYWVWLTWITPPFFFYLIKPLVKWYMKKKYLDMQSDPLQYDKYCRSLDAANPSRLRRSALNFSKYKIWNKLNKINNKVLIFTGSKDKMHGYDQTLKISQQLKNCEIIDMETNAQTHSEDMVNKLYYYLNRDLRKFDKSSD